MISMCQDIADPDRVLHCGEPFRQLFAHCLCQILIALFDLFQRISDLPRHPLKDVSFVSVFTIVIKTCSRDKTFNATAFHFDITQPRQGITTHKSVPYLR